MPCKHKVRPCCATPKKKKKNNVKITWNVRLRNVSKASDRSVRVLKLSWSLIVDRVQSTKKGCINFTVLNKAFVNRTGRTEEWRWRCSWALSLQQQQHFSRVVCITHNNTHTHWSIWRPHLCETACIYTRVAFTMFWFFFFFIHIYSVEGN